MSMYACISLTRMIPEQLCIFFFFTQEIKKENVWDQFSQLFPGETFISLNQPVTAMITVHPQAALSPIFYMHF